MRRCPLCGCTETHYDHVSGETLCAACGTVLEERSPSTTPPKKLFFNKENLGPGITHLLHDQGVGTIRTGRFSSPEEKLLTRLLSEIAWISDKLGLTKSVAEKAGELGRRAIAQNLFRRVRRASAAAVVYIASNQQGLCKTLEEVASASDVPLTMLGKEVSKLVFGLKIRLKPLDCEVLITRFGKILELEQEIVDEACRLYRDRRISRVLMGRKPSAVSAAIMYLACRNKGHRIPLSKVAESCRVSVLTLRKTIASIQSAVNDQKDVNGEFDTEKSKATDLRK